MANKRNDAHPMTQPKSQSGRLTAAEQTHVMYYAQKDGCPNGHSLCGKICYGCVEDALREKEAALAQQKQEMAVMVAELQRMKAVLMACAEELHYAVDMQNDYSMTDAGRKALKQADDILNAALLTDAPAGTKEDTNGL